MIYILSGPSGAGKSTYARARWPLSDVYTYSADHYFQVSGEYKFDASCLGDAHAWCFRRYVTELQAWEKFPHKLPSPIVVDNTNTTSEEIAPYVLAARAFGQEHKVVTLLCSAEFAAKRTVHGVPMRTIEKQLARIKSRKMPSHWNYETLFVEEDNAIP